jgi:hypothetical protein
MADEAFALSPISARAAQPSEADYDAIQEAFMETSRGRWFLGEYAKRNRNADTKMVLDAVSRIEETLAAQKKPDRDPLLDQALESLRTALTQARDAAQIALADLALEQNLAPVRKGARVIREIAWRLREIGADGRICDLIDSQVGAIEGAAARMAPADLAGALSGAFDRIEDKIAAFDAGEAATPPAATPVATAQAEVHAETPTAAAVADPVASDESPVALTEEVAAAASSEPPDAFDANDEAMLDMIAMEMAAPDTDAAYEPKLDDAQIFEDQAHESQIHASQMDDANTDEPAAEVASYEIDVTFPDSSDVNDAPATATALPVVTPLRPMPAPEPEPVAQLAPEPAPSLGSSLIANGIVPRPRASRPDPLAPIRRMSQTEKIAFFS